MRRFASLRRRSEFGRLRRQGRRLSTETVTLYRREPKARDRTSLVGITVSTSIGKAVVRNTVRRRLAEAVHEALAGRSPMRLLFVARPAAVAAPYATLRADVTSALIPRLVDSAGAPNPSPRLVDSAGAPKGRSQGA